MRIVILTGAGISAESGLGTFRDVGGLWDQYDLDEVATPQGFAQNPELVHEFYNARRANCIAATPNKAHTALALLQDQMPEVTLVTQNIDDLHERAGSSAVIHMHGELRRALCAACGVTWPAPAEMQWDAPCPVCAAPCSRPDVVWFGEVPYHMDRIVAAIESADVFAAIGTSGTVYPAAGFGAHARQNGVHTVEINPDPTGLFDETVAGPATKAVPQWADHMLRVSGQSHSAR